MLERRRIQTDMASASLRTHNELLKPLQNLIPERIVVTDSTGKLSSSTMYSADLSSGGGIPPSIATVRRAGETYIPVLESSSDMTLDGGHVLIEGKGFVPGMQVTVGSTQVASSWISSTRIGARLPPKAVGEYDVSVTSSHTLPKAIRYIDVGGPFTGEGGDEVNNVLGEDGKTYTEHVFKKSGEFVVKGSLGEIEVLVVGGGGAGGNVSGGGGGGGGFINKKVFLKQGTYAVGVGAGGGAKSNGERSYFDDIIAYGGGRGFGDTPATLGASGGGGMGLGIPGSALEGQGYPGGKSIQEHSTNCGGGGGGAGGPGKDVQGNPNGNLQKPGEGGVGKLFHGKYYGGGGGGRGISLMANGGLGGGGSGSHNASGPVAGADNSGGGGGGGGAGAPGGSGVVIIRYIREVMV